MLLWVILRNKPMINDVMNEERLVINLHRMMRENIVGDDFENAVIVPKSNDG
jgi:hypothetical protein